MTDTPIPLTKDQCREALIRLQEYGRFMYYSPQGVALFKNRPPLTVDGRQFTMAIESDGKISATLGDTGVKVIFDTVCTTAPVSHPDTLDNVEYNVRVANAADLQPADAEYGKRIGIFALSFLQRAAFFQFLHRMAPPTIDGIAGDLAFAQ